MMKFIKFLKISLVLFFSLNISFFSISASAEPWQRNLNNLIINPSSFKIFTGELGFNTSDPCVVYSNKTKKFHVLFSSHSNKLNKQFLFQAIATNPLKKWNVLKLPVLVPNSNSWDSRTVETCSIVEAKINGSYKYYLYYSGSKTLDGGDRDIYNMGLAVSDDLIKFTRIRNPKNIKGADGLLFKATDSFYKNKDVTDGIITDPTVLIQNDEFKMWFYCAGKNSSGKFIDGGICYASSKDGIHWDHKGALPSLLNYMVPGVIPQQPTVIFDPFQKVYRMWLVIDDPMYESYGVSGLAVGGYYQAISKDGINWTYLNKTNYDFTWSKAFASENKGLGNGPSVIYAEGLYYLFYSSFTNQGIPGQGYGPFTWGLNIATKRKM